MTQLKKESLGAKPCHALWALLFSNSVQDGWSTVRRKEPYQPVSDCRLDKEPSDDPPTVIWHGCRYALALHHLFLFWGIDHVFPGDEFFDMIVVSTVFGMQKLSYCFRFYDNPALREILRSLCPPLVLRGSPYCTLDPRLWKWCHDLLMVPLKMSAPFPWQYSLQCIQQLTTRVAFHYSTGRIKSRRFLLSFVLEPPLVHLSTLKGSA